MSILIDELYKKYKAETAIGIIVVTLIGLVWQYFDSIAPLFTTTKITLSYALKTILSLGITLLALVTYIIYLYKKINQKNIAPLDSSLFDFSKFKRQKP